MAAKLKQGILRISVTTLAQEADHSRTLIGHKSCKYPRVRDKLMALREDCPEPKTAADVITRKREETSELKRKLKVAHSEMAALVLRMDQMETDAKRKIREATRRMENKGKNPHVIAGAGLKSKDTETGKVIPFPEPEDT
ncbi:MAG: hypothetical protein HYR80_09100 [Nitrospirae bacterium]|nr:hypothetical protein [Nitrospirota bacterium]